MAGETRALFERAAEVPFEPRLRDVHGTVRFEVAGAGTWRVTVDDGSITVGEGAGAAECVVRIEEAELRRLMRSEQNALTAFMQGRLAVEGTPGLALAVCRLLMGLSAAGSRG